MTGNELPDSVKKEHNESVKSIIEKLQKDLHPQTIDTQKENEKASEAPSVPETPNVPKTSDEFTR